MKHSKQIRSLIALLLCVCMIFALGACKVSGSEDAPKKKTRKTTATTEESTEPTPTEPREATGTTATSASSMAPSEGSNTTEPVVEINGFGESLGNMLREDINGIGSLGLPDVGNVMEFIVDAPETLLGNRSIYTWLNSQLTIADAPEMLTSILSGATLEGEILTGNDGTAYASVNAAFDHLSNADFGAEAVLQDGTLYISLPEYCDAILKTDLPNFGDFSITDLDLSSLLAAAGIPPEMLESIDTDGVSRILDQVIALLGQVLESAFSAIPDSACSTLGTVDVSLGSGLKTVSANLTEITFDGDILHSMAVNALSCVRDSALTEQIVAEVASLVESVTGQPADPSVLLDEIYASLNSALDELTPDVFDFGDDIALTALITSDADGVYEVQLILAQPGGGNSISLTYGNTIYQGVGRFSIDLQYSENNTLLGSGLLDLSVEEDGFYLEVRFYAEDAISAELAVSGFFDDGFAEFHVFASFAQGDEHIQGNAEIYFDRDGDDIMFELVLTDLDFFIFGEQLLSGSLDLYFTVDDNTDAMEFYLDGAVDAEEYMQDPALAEAFTSRLSENPVLSYLLIRQ